jgi:hypothetical protein
MAIADLIEAAMRAFGMYVLGPAIAYGLVAVVVLTLYRKMRDIT